MIEITRYESKYETGLKKMMLMEQLNFDDITLCLDHTYVVLEGQEVLGFGYYNIYDDEIYVDHLFIKRNERLNHLGDSLFRAILNSLYLMQVPVVYMRADERYNKFLEHEDLYLNEGRYTIDLTSFFNRKCKSEKASQTPLQ
ncbi:MAG: hypothetical protein JXR88_15740 [Clostridia bacterium]|nr:hypothetical protein [Clostridia bacterium]